MRVGKIQNHKKSGVPIVCLTAYTTPMAKSLASHVDLLLVGDSVGTVLYGMDSTQGVSLDMMIEHGRAVMRAEPDVPVIIDMPHGSYEDNDAQALENAKVIIEQTGADGVKLEGGRAMASRVEAIVSAGIPVMGHIGLLPQSAPDEGGYKIKGKTDEQIQILINDGQSIENSGAFAIVIEGTIDEAAAQITSAVSIPTIGIGASSACDGQILVSEDLLGLTHGHRPKFAPDYAGLNAQIDEAATRFAADVRGRNFPREENLYRKKA